MTRVAVLSPEPVRSRMAGMAIRAARIARELAAAGHSVTLAAPAGTEVEELPSVSVVELGDALPREVLDADVAIASGHAGVPLVSSGFEGAVVADLYDPFLIENLAYAPSLGPRVFENDTRALFALLDRADLVLAAGEEQRLFYLGLLLGRSRLHPGLLGNDPSLSRVVATVPFGVDDEPPGESRPHPELSAGPADVLFGGVYDWYDPELALAAWPRILAAEPRARLVFTRSPNPGSTPQLRLEEAVRHAEERGWMGRSVRVVSWVPHHERGAFYASCALALVAHRPSLETSLSFRTRILDFLWAGLPVVATEGGAGNALLAEAGRVVRADPDAVAEAVIAVLTDAGLRTRLSNAARQAVACFRWKAVLAPLLSFAAEPRRLPPAPRTSWTRRARTRAVRILGRAAR